ncbi:MAG TPA: hypothetical protein VEK57_01235 [Thermoanaerobaculia bacterium]|nr:hypothetical protein [Thermoanaerobaculia bacterium]
MRITCAVVVAVGLVGSAAGIQAAELQCATSPENDRRIAALHARPREQARVAAGAVAAPPALRDGVIYLPANDEVTPGYRPFDLAGESLLFRPGSEGRYAVSREPLRYTEPSSAGQVTTQFLTADLGFTFSAFGRSVQRVYVAAFIGITFDEPRYDDATGFSEVEALMRPQPLIAPLAQTSRSLRPPPAVHVDRTPSSLIVTWRSISHPSFGYDVQAELHQDGSIVFSYNSLRNVHWGAPVLAPGGAPRRTLFDVQGANGTTSQVDPALRDMVDMRRVEVFRIAESEVVSLRMTLAAPIDRSKIPNGQWLTYEFLIATESGTDGATVQVTRNDTFVNGFGTSTLDRVTGRVEGNTVEIFGLQRAPGTASTQRLNVVTFVSGSGRPADVAEYEFPLDAAQRRIATDLSAANGSELPLPIVEPFLLPVLDPFAVWDQVKAATGFRDDEIDGMAIYQTFFTDLLLFGTAYAAVGNPQVDGIHPPEPDRGTGKPRYPTLIHMNQLSYDENADERLASAVLLHEFGHRWLYTLRFADGPSTSNILSPQRYHPAAYVDTRSAFPLYGPQESSVMGGGSFTSLGGNRYRARSLHYGYSWTDLYLMGLADAEEVPSWFYLGSTNPQLPNAYFPTDGIEVTGTKRDVTLSQVVAAQGPRNPSPAMSPRDFRVLFVLLTDPGKEPAAEEIAKMEDLRTTMERDFSRATGGRGSVTTNRPPQKKRRSVR